MPTRRTFFALLASFIPAWLLPRSVKADAPLDPVKFEELVWEKEWPALPNDKIVMTRTTWMKLRYIATGILVNRSILQWDEIFGGSALGAPVLFGSKVEFSDESAVDGWIPVTERLPELKFRALIPAKADHSDPDWLIPGRKSELVLVSNGTEITDAIYVEPAGLRTNGKFSNWLGCPGEGLTHWRPFPAPPVILPPKAPE